MRRLTLLVNAGRTPEIGISTPLFSQVSAGFRKWFRNLRDDEGVQRFGNTHIGRLGEVAVANEVGGGLSHCAG